MALGTGRVLLAAMLAVSWLFARPPLRDAVTWEAAADVRLVVPRGYVLCSPVCRTMDALAMMSVVQLVVSLLSAVALYLGWRRWRRWRRGARVADPSAERRAALVAVATAAVLAGATVAAPYPMVSLRTLRADEVRVDFHSHTSSSHDGRRGFDATARRAWHRTAGFDAAYVSDHRVFDGAEASLAGNPPRAGDGTVLLPAYEGRYLGSFVIFLGLRGADARLIDDRRHLRDGLSSAGRLPVSVAVPPGLLLRDVNVQSRDSLPRVRALQLWDGSPVAAWQGQRERASLLARANALQLPVVAGTNNHGWGRTPAAWNLVQIPAWRSLTPDSLGAALEDVLRSAARGRVRVVERVRADPRGALIPLMLTLPVAAWDTLSTLTPFERLAWMGWGLAGGALVSALRRRRQRGTA